MAYLYNPHEQSKEQLIQGFVVRRKLFQQLFRDIKSADMLYPEQHYLIEGQRGSGKTTLLLRLSYEIENDAELHRRLMPVVLKEEAYYGITRLFTLWEATALEYEACLFPPELPQKRCMTNIAVRIPDKGKIANTFGSL